MFLAEPEARRHASQFAVSRASQSMTPDSALRSLPPAASEAS
jgi:hypothetical protein